MAAGLRFTFQSGTSRLRLALAGLPVAPLLPLEKGEEEEEEEEEGILQAAPVSVRT